MADTENPPTDSETKGCCWTSKKKSDAPVLYKKPILVEFRDFIFGGNLVRIAVAFVIALALEDLIKQFIGAFVSPIIGIIGNSDIETLAFTIRDSPFRYGKFLDSLLAFIVICIVIFFLLILPLQRYGGRCVPSWVIRKCPFCYADIAAIATRCQACTSDVEPLNIVPPKEE